MLHFIPPLLSTTSLPVPTSPKLRVSLCRQLSLPLYKNDISSTHFGASALAVDTIARYGASAAVPLFTDQMISAMGFDWTVSLLACLTVLLLPVPWVIFRWGPKLRSRSTYVRLATEQKEKDEEEEGRDAESSVGES